VSSEIQNTGAAFDVDPITDSVDAFLVVVFPKSTSQNFSIVLSIAKEAGKFAETMYNGKPLHYACFMKNPADAARCIAFLRYVLGWKGIVFFSSGKIITDIYQLQSILECYVEASQVSDYKAHCFFTRRLSEKRHRIEPIVIQLSVDGTASKTSTDEKEDPVYIIPCKRFENRDWSIDPYHPSTVEAQFQAKAVELGCNLCPNFKVGEFKSIDNLDDKKSIKKEKRKKSFFGGFFS
jgi:hypothetical protein